MMASTTAWRSCRGSWVQTRGCGRFGMVVPPGGAYSLEGRHEVGNSGQGEHGGLGQWCRGAISAAEGNVAEAAGENLSQAMADVSGEIGNACQLEDAAE